jgi:hypothetical protein
LRGSIGVLVRGIWILEGLARVLVHPYELRGLVLCSLMNTNIVILNVHILKRITEVSRFFLLMTAVATLPIRRHGRCGNWSREDLGWKYMLSDRGRLGLLCERTPNWATLCDMGGRATM